MVVILRWEKAVNRQVSNGKILAHWIGFGRCRLWQKKSNFTTSIRQSNCANLNFRYKPAPC
jgi:hypothetical protein